jgi:hypothetical protein
LEIFCTRSNTRLLAARQFYEKRQDSNLADRVKKELSGDLERLCLRLLTEERYNRNFNADQIADQLYAYGEGKWGTNEAGFIDIFSSNSQEQLQQVAVAYENKYHHSLARAIESEFSGLVKTALTYLLHDKIDVTCILLKKATIDKIGTDEGLVNRCIGGYDKIGIQEIARRFFRY